MIGRRAITIAAAAMAAMLLLLLAGLMLRAWYTDNRRARLERNQSGASIASGRDALGAAIGAQANAAQADRITRENDDAITNAAGADDPVNPAVRDAGFDSLCRRAAYRGSAQCVQRTHPR